MVNRGNRITAGQRVDSSPVSGFDLIDLLSQAQVLSACTFLLPVLSTGALDSCPEPFVLRRCGSAVVHRADPTGVWTHTGSQAAARKVPAVAPRRPVSDEYPLLVTQGWLETPSSDLGALSASQGRSRVFRRSARALSRKTTLRASRVFFAGTGWLRF